MRFSHMKVRVQKAHGDGKRRRLTWSICALEDGEWRDVPKHSIAHIESAGGLMWKECLLHPGKAIVAPPGHRHHTEGSDAHADVGFVAEMPTLRVLASDRAGRCAAECLEFLGVPCHSVLYCYTSIKACIETVRGFNPSQQVLRASKLG